jgi:hypothetical protein
LVARRAFTSETGLYFEKHWLCRYVAPRYYDAQTGHYVLRGEIPLHFESGSSFAGDNPWTRRRREARQGV